MVSDNHPSEFYSPIFLPVFSGRCRVGADRIKTNFEGSRWSVIELGSCGEIKLVQKKLPYFVKKMEYTSYFDNEPTYLHNESEDLLEVQDSSIEYCSDWDSVCADWRDRCKSEKPQCRPDVPQKSN